MAERYNPNPGARGSGAFLSLDRSLSLGFGVNYTRIALGDIRHAADSIQKTSGSAHAVEGVLNRVRTIHPQRSSIQEIGDLTTAVSYGIVSRAFYDLLQGGKRTTLARVGLQPGGSNAQTGLVGGIHVVLQQLHAEFRIAQEDFLPEVTHASIQDHYVLMMENRIPDFKDFIESFLQAALPENRRTELHDAMIDAFVLGFMRAGNPDDDLSRGVGGARPPLPPTPSDEQPAGVPRRPRPPYGSSGAALPLPDEEPKAEDLPEVLLPSRR